MLLQMSSALFRKSLRLSNKSRLVFSKGKPFCLSLRPVVCRLIVIRKGRITTMLSQDAVRLERTYFWLHQCVSQANGESKS